MRMQSVRVELLGDFRIGYGEQQIRSINSPRLQSLIAYLILHRDAPQSRQHLAFLLYPDSTESQARTNLRNLFHLLRHAIPDSDSFLASDTLTLQWRCDSPFTLDVLEFERAQQMGDSVETLQRAAELYRGDLLPGCYDDWILPEREHLRQDYIAIRERLVRWFVEREEYRTAQVNAQLLLRCDPLREETYRTLMQLSAQSGDRAGVARFYKTCAAVMRRELGVEPSAETQTVFAQLTRDLSRLHPTRSTTPTHARNNNLLLYLDRFVGREAEKEQVTKLVGNYRLVTLIGAGGVGKTRLCMAVASDLLEDPVRDEFCDGIWLIDLAPLSDAAVLAQAVASVVGVRESPGRELADTLVDWLRARHLLLVLDNCEHLVQGVRDFAQNLLGAAPGVRMLATSRQLLGIAGERIFRVPPLQVPDTGQSEWGQNESELAWCESVRLFADRATVALPTFRLTQENANAVAQICRRLDGIPLAIELAAARVKLLKPQEIAQGLNDAFHLLTRGSPGALSHHRTLGAAMDWSYEMLSEKERTLLRRLSVFAGGFTVQAAEAICGDECRENHNGARPLTTLDILSDLVDKSLVSLEPHEDGTRPFLLEIVRQYARAKLADSGEESLISARHLEFFARFAEEAEPKLSGAEQKRRMTSLETEHDNLRVALEWSRSDTRYAEAGMRLAGALSLFWEMKGYLTEGLHWLGLVRRDAEAAAPLRAKTTSGFATLTWLQGAYAKATVYHNEALDLYRKLGDLRGVAFSLNNLAVQAGNMGQIDRAETLLLESVELARNAGDKRLTAFALGNLGEVARCRNDWEAAIEQYQASLALFDEVGDKYNCCSPLNSLALVARTCGNYLEAATLYRRSLSLACELESKLYIAESLEGLAAVSGQKMEWWNAAKLYGAAAGLRESIGAWGSLQDQGDYETNVAYIGAQLGEERYKAAWLEGKQLSQEQATRYALEASG